MSRVRHFKTVFKNEVIKIAGQDPSYSITWTDGKSIIIERFADGWYTPGELEQHWTDADLADLGGIIEQKFR